jgi:HD-like signal output (HDOD) protein
MKNVLFVDDDSNVLNGLRRLLHLLRNEWNMTFVDSGVRALTAMEREPFDVIISDIRMPGMDGIRLLGHVRESYPHVVRIVLSGQSERDLTLKSAATAHQYLSKPCDAETLKNTIARAFALKEKLEKPSLQALVSAVGSLPSVPSLYLKLVRALDHPESSIQDVADIISQDTAMIAKVLQLANSAFFGIRRRISSPKDAALYLGFDNLKALTLSVQVFSQFRHSSTRFSIDELARHGQITGALARKVAQLAGCPSIVIDDSLMAGLLHDVGKLVLVNAFPNEYDRAVASSETTGESLYLAEREAFGATHAEIGTYLLWLWGMPDSVVEAVAYHHEPSKCPVHTMGALAAVHIADALVHAAPPWLDERLQEHIDLDYLESLGVTERLPAWRDAISALHSIPETS